jgi:hypothetical protein
MIDGGAIGRVQMDLDDGSCYNDGGPELERNGVGCWCT